MSYSLKKKLRGLLDVKNLDKANNSELISALILSLAFIPYFYSLFPYIVWLSSFADFIFLCSKYINMQ